MINKILEISTPKDKKELESFMEMITFYSKYYPQRQQYNTTICRNTKKKKAEFI